MQFTSGSVVFSRCTILMLEPTSGRWGMLKSSSGGCWSSAHCSSRWATWSCANSKPWKLTKMNSLTIFYKQQDVFAKHHDTSKSHFGCQRSMSRSWDHWLLCKVLVLKNIHNNRKKCKSLWHHDYLHDLTSGLLMADIHFQDKKDHFWLMSNMSNC